MSKAKITQEDIVEMQRLRDEGMMVKDIARRFGVSAGRVCKRTVRKEPEEDCNWQKKARWPEWQLWDNLHQRYGKRKVEK